MSFTTDPGGRDTVREPVMRDLRAGVRERQMRGQSVAQINDWIDRQEAEGAITQEERAVARLVTRHYTRRDQAA